MPSVAENCLKFRQETLAPSGGWLASLAIGLSISTGIFEYTILAIVWTVSFIIIRTASCESAMVLALAYDLIIPFQYQNVGRHQAELERYWPKFMIGCMIEGLCYLLLHPDLFNFAVIAKTTIMLTIWMSGKKQYPLNLHKDTPAPARPREPSRSERPERRSDNTDTPASSSTGDEPSSEYLNYVNEALKKLTGDKKVDDNKRRGITSGLRKPDKRKAAEESLKKRKIPTYEQWKKAKEGGGGSSPTVPGSSGPPPAAEAGAAAKTDRMGSEQIARVNDQLKKSGKLDDTTRQKFMKRLQKPFADPDWEAARKELAEKGMNLPSAHVWQASLKHDAPPPAKDPNWRPSEADLGKLKADYVTKSGQHDGDEVVAAIRHGPTHPEFHSNINWLRTNGVDTRKILPRKASDKKVYIIPFDIQQRVKPMLDSYFENDRNAKWVVEQRLTRQAATLEDFKATIKKLNDSCPQLNLVVETPQEQEATPWGAPMSTYYHGLRLARDAGNDKESEFEALYDWLSDPTNQKDPKKPNSGKDKEFDAKEKFYNEEFGTGKDMTRQDGSGGRAGIPSETVLSYRAYLDAEGDQGGGYAENIKDAILLEIKSAATRAEGEAIWNRVKSAQSMPARLAIMKEFGEKTPEQLAWVAKNKAAEERAAAERQL